MIEVTYEMLMGALAFIGAVYAIFKGYKALGGGVDSESQFRKDMMQELENLRNTNKTLRMQYDEAMLELTELKIQMAILETEWKARSQMFESAHNHLPVPMWVKDTDGKMLALNEAYEKTFLEPLGKKKIDYVGKTDTEIWGETIGKQFLENDMLVLTTEETWRGFEVVVDGEGHHDSWYIIKYVWKIDGIKVGIGGMAIDPRMMVCASEQERQGHFSDEDED